MRKAGHKMSVLQKTLELVAYLEWDTISKL